MRTTCPAFESNKDAFLPQLVGIHTIGTGGGSSVTSISSYHVLRAKCPSLREDTSLEGM